MAEILSYGEGIYLIEAKWNRSSEHAAGKVVVRRPQVLRHRIFRWYLQQWRATDPPDWSTFHGTHADPFAAEFPGFAIAPPASVLASNLEFVLQRLSGAPARVPDVLLHIGLPGAPRPQGVEPVEFELVHIEADVVSPGGFFNLHQAG